METRVARVGGSDLERDPVIRSAASLLREGQLVAFPTETVYGLGADALSQSAVRAIFEAKSRPADNPVIVHIADLSDLPRVGRIEDAAAHGLLEKFWPGPLTVVIPASRAMRSTVSRGLETVAVRIPAHPVALALIRATERPIAAPSANLSGRPSPTVAEHVLEDLEGRIPLILDGGACDVGIESTVLDLSGEEAAILRPGAITAEEIAAELGRGVTLAGAHPERSPGTRHRHYQPRAPVIAIGLDVPGDAVTRLLEHLSGLQQPPRIGYIAARNPSKAEQDHLGPGASEGAWLLDRTGPGLLTRNFYRDVRNLDRREAQLIFVEAVDEDRAIMDRLSRASSRVLSLKDFDDPELVDRLLSLIPD